MSLPSNELSVRTLLEQVRSQYPDTPFLALGQTALWDEPTKAVWRRLLDSYYPEAPLIAAVHDTDYFAKTTAHLDHDQPYALLPHDDGRTRDLWSAAGEISSLFGSESVPTRHMYLQQGVPFDWLARGYPAGKDAFYAETTTAWGWRGIVYTEANNVVAHDVPMQQIGPALLEQLDWAFGESVSCLADPDAQSAAQKTAQMIRGWVTEFLQTCTEDCRLSDLYQTLLPQLYSLLLGAVPDRLETSSSTALFQFNVSTASRPRFAILDAFLNPATRAACCRAYDRAVAGSGSGIYTLSEFGEGVIPFDLVIPGIGRGTIHLTEGGGLTVQTAPQPTVIPGPPVTTAFELAECVQAAYGTECVLVGKAVTLVDMLAAEYLIVFHETASGYTPITRQMNEYLQAQGITLPLCPIMRLGYATWDALASAPEHTAFRLPGHLAVAFGREQITAREFSAQWRSVVEDQRRRLQMAREPHKLRDLLSYLESLAQDGQCWCERLDEYESQLSALKTIAEHSGILGDRIAEHRNELKMWQKERLALETRKGEDWRANIQPLLESIREKQGLNQEVTRLQHDLGRQIALRSTAFDLPLGEVRDRIAATRLMVSEFRRQRRLLERGPEALQARAAIDQIAREAQMARMRVIRDAYLTVESLAHTDLRPTGWWLPMVTPNGEWLAAMVQTASARLEPLL